MRLNIPQLILAKLAQSDRHQIRSQEVPGSTFTAGNFLLKLFCSFFLNFGGHKSFLWGHWCPCYGPLVVTSPMSFKARVGSLIGAWWRCTCYMFPEIHPWCDTCQPFGSQYNSQANLFHIPVSRHWWGSKLGPIILQTNDKRSTDWTMLH